MVLTTGWQVMLSFDLRLEALVEDHSTRKLKLDFQEVGKKEITFEIDDTRVYILSHDVV